MSKKKRKIEELKVEILDWDMMGGFYKEEYHGKVVTDSSLSSTYCDIDGKTMFSISTEIKKLLLEREVTVINVVDIDAADAAIEATARDGGASLIDSIGAKPTKINIEF